MRLPQSWGCALEWMSTGSPAGARMPCARPPQLSRRWRSPPQDRRARDGGTRTAASRRACSAKEAHRSRATPRLAPRAAHPGHRLGGLRGARQPRLGRGGRGKGGPGRRAAGVDVAPGQAARAVSACRPGAHAPPSRQLQHRQAGSSAVLARQLAKPGLHAAPACSTTAHNPGALHCGALRPAPTMTAGM